jgi:hypothetical protein
MNSQRWYKELPKRICADVDQSIGEDDRCKELHNYLYPLELTLIAWLFDMLVETAALQDINMMNPKNLGN